MDWKPAKSINKANLNTWDLLSFKFYLKWLKIEKEIDFEESLFIIFVKDL